MRKPFFFLFLAFILLFGLVACGKTVVEPGENGIAHGEKGDVMRTPLFDFEVTEVSMYSKYAGQTPVDGEKFVDVCIRLTNTSNDALLLLDTDFQLQWGASGFTDPLVAFDEGMAPLEFTLEAGASAEYHYVFSVSKNVTDFSLCYLYEPETEGEATIYYVRFTA